MPVYEFQCKECKHITNIIAQMSDAYIDEVKCEKCGESARRILSTFKYRKGRGGQPMRLR